MAPIKKDSGRENSAPKKRGAGKTTTRDLTRRHLKDKNDKITDEDIQNIDIDMKVKDEDLLKLPEDRPHDVDKDNKKSTPWDIISE